MRQRVSAPSPAVQHLPTIFRRIETGEIRVPTFQRGFVWKKPQVIELLESVYRGYPIGSLLFWKVEDRQIDPGQLMADPFPKIKEKYPLAYVLDGQQRLATLYGCFHAAHDSRNEFKVSFDLRSEKFVHSDDMEEETARFCIALVDLFSPRQFLEAQKRLMLLPKSDSLLEQSVNLHSTFQEYMLPIVTIENRSVDDVVNIFERINNTGVRLSAVDFMRALTWSATFDLNEQIRHLKRVALSEGFKIPAETIVKILVTSLDRDPVVEDMLNLRRASAQELMQGVEATEKALLKAIRFVKERFRILSYDFVPYEGLFIVLCRLFSLQSRPPSNVIKHIERWFWSVGLSEALRGKPDHYVARAIGSLKRLIGGDFDMLKQRFMLTQSELLERRFIKGKALSSSIAALFAVNGAKSLITGEPIPPSLFMDEFEGQDYKGWLSTEELSMALDRKISTPKLLANILLLPERSPEIPVESKGTKLLYWMQQRFGEKTESILLSQFIDSRCVEYLAHGDMRTFLTARARAIVAAAELVATD